MEIITPLITIITCLIRDLFKRTTTAENVAKGVHNLERALEELMEVRDDLQKEVDQAVSKGLTLSSQVKGWLARVDEAVDEVREIREEKDEKKQCMYCCRTKCFSRYELGKRIEGLRQAEERVVDLEAAEARDGLHFLLQGEEMEHVIREEEVVEEDYLNAFSKLRIISIRDAPKLVSICSKAMVFPCLKRIADRPKLRKLPLKAYNVSELPTLYCSKQWWGNLVWDDTHTKATFFPYFMEA